MSDDLDKLAAKGAKDQDARDAARERDKRVARKARKALKHRTLARSLAAGGPKWIWVPVLFAPLATSMALPFFLEGTVEVVAFAVLAVWIGVGMFVAMKWTERRGVAHALRWLNQLPFAFDIEAYLDGLRDEGMERQIRLRVVFANTPSEADQQLFGNAAAGAVPMGRPHWRGNALTLTSDKRSTYVMGNGDRDGYHTNAALHRWTVELVDTALRSIHARQPIDRVEVSFP